MIPFLVLAHLAILFAKASNGPVRGDIGHELDYKHDTSIIRSRQSIFTKEIVVEKSFRYGVVKINVKNTTEMGCNAQSEFIVEKNDFSGFFENNDYTGLLKVILDANNKAVILGQFHTRKSVKKRCQNKLSTQYPDKCYFNATHYECQIDLVPVNQASGGDVEYKIEKDYGVFSLYHQGQPIKNAADNSDLRFSIGGPCHMLDENISFDIKLHAKTCPVLDEMSDETCDSSSSSFDREGCVKYLNKNKDFFQLIESKIEVDVSKPYYEQTKQIHSFRDFKNHFNVIKKIPSSQEDDEDVLWTAARKTDIVRRNEDGLGLSFGLGNLPNDEQNVVSTGVVLQYKESFNSDLVIARVKTQPRLSCGLSAYFRIRGTGTSEAIFFSLESTFRIEPFFDNCTVSIDPNYKFSSQNGTGFIYAIEKTTKYFRFWVWNIQEADELVKLSNPDPLSWGQPTLELIRSKSCVTSIFDVGKLEFEVAMCGKLQHLHGILPSPSQCLKTCEEEWEKDRNHWKDARWHIEEIAIYKRELKSSKKLPPPTKAIDKLPPPVINGLKQLPPPNNGTENPSLPNINRIEEPFLPDNGTEKPSLPDNDNDLPFCEDEEEEEGHA